MPATSLQLVYDRRRLWRQTVGLTVLLLVVIAFGLFGVWMIVAVVQTREVAPILIGGVIGLFFALIGLACCISGVEWLVNAYRMRAPRVVFVVDLDGIDSVNDKPLWWTKDPAHHPSRATRWSNTESVTCRRRYSRSRPSLAWPEVTDGLDHHVGRGMMLRDGIRTVTVVRKDGSRVEHNLSLAVGDLEFAAVGRRIAAFARTHDVPCDLTWG